VRAEEFFGQFKPSNFSKQKQKLLHGQEPKLSIRSDSQFLSNKTENPAKAEQDLPQASATSRERLRFHS